MRTYGRSDRPSLPLKPSESFTAFCDDQPNETTIKKAADSVQPKEVTLNSKQNLDLSRKRRLPSTIKPTMKSASIVSFLSAEQKLVKAYKNEHDKENRGLYDDVKNKRKFRSYKLKSKIGPEQLQLNLIGSSVFKSCKDCGMTYNKTSSEDNALHLKHHEQMLVGVKYPIWSSDTVIHGIDVPVLDPRINGKSSSNSLKRNAMIIMVEGSVDGAQGRKLREILEVVDTILSSAELEKDQLAKCKVFMIITEGRVIATAVVQAINQAHRIISENLSTSSTKDKLLVTEVEKTDNRTNQVTQHSVFCTKELFPVKLGIHRIYVSPAYRRKGLATSLLNAAAQNAIYGMNIPRQDIAFSQPTGDGAALAANWSRANNNGGVNGGDEYYYVFMEN